MKISYGLTVCNEHEELKNLIEYLIKRIDGEDEIVVVYDQNRVTPEVLKVIEDYKEEANTHPFNFQQNFLENKNYKNSKCTGDYIFQIDADEILTSSLIAEIKNKLPQLDKNVNGIYIKRHLVFQDTLIKYGRLSPVRLLRLFRFQKGKCDNRWVDEKIKVEGKTVQFKEYIIDQNLKSLSEWIRKHDRYSSAEALNYLLIKYNPLFNNIEQSQLNFETLSVVSLKSRNLYAKLPLIIRAFIIFSYRYFFCLGFLHGKAGLIYFFLQSLWYRILVDAKILEVEKLIKKNTKIDLAIKEKLKVDVKNI
jgi:hypothetical protein